MMVQQQSYDKETVNKNDLNGAKKTGRNMSTHGSIQTEASLGKNKIVVYEETCMSKAAKPFGCDKKKYLELHKNGKEKSQRDENPEEASRDGLLDVVGQTSLVGQ